MKYVAPENELLLSVPSLDLDNLQEQTSHAIWRRQIHYALVIGTLAIVHSSHSIAQWCPTPAGKGPQKCHPFGLRLRSVSFDSQSGSRWGRWPSGHLRQRCQGWRCKMMQSTSKYPKTSELALKPEPSFQLSPLFIFFPALQSANRRHGDLRPFFEMVWNIPDVWSIGLKDMGYATGLRCFFGESWLAQLSPTKKRTCPAGVFLMVLKELPSSDGNVTWEHHGTSGAAKT